jgi:hypothetical protein
LKALTLLIAFALLQGGCVTSAEQTASQRDIAAFSRSVAANELRSNLDPESFFEDAQAMVKTKIDFHGIVVDDDGNPIKDAKVQPTIFDRLVDPFEFPFFSFTNREPIVTGNNGRFKITGEQGAGMYVRVEVPGWAPVSAPRKLYVFAEGLNQTLPFPTRAAPAEFRFETRPPDAELRDIGTGALRLLPGGKPLELSLREVSPYGVEPGTSEAIVACERTLIDAAPDAEFDWWCELTVPGGGMLVYELEMERAPETGYQETGRLEYHAGDPDWDDRADRQLIIRFADGTYGYVTISMRMDGDFYVAFDGFWNPTGSIWLD